MKRIFATTSAVLAIAGVAGLVGAERADATPPAGVTITLVRAPDLTPDGWSAAGAIVDSGSWTSDNGHFGALPSPKTGTTHLLTTETGRAGTFRIHFDGMFNPNDGSFGGQWVIQDGTGVYANLHGQGSWLRTFSLDGHLIFTCLGTLHFD